jgi:mannitol-1-/sugar-/sorbitol-6-phosphatase
VDSRDCIEFVWRTWAERHRRDPAPILAVAHGRRTSETLRDVAPELDIPTEVAALEALEAVETRGVRPVPGAAELLADLPRDRWAVVTSGSPAVAQLRLRVALIPPPPHLITAADVRTGKPSPEGYLQAAARLGVAPAACVVLEDAAAGITAGRAAGMRVIAVAGTVSPEVLAQADYQLARLQDLQLGRESTGELRLRFAGG